MPRYFHPHCLIASATALVLGFAASSAQAGPNAGKTVVVEKRKEVKRNYLPPPPPPPCLLVDRIREWIYNRSSYPYLTVLDPIPVRVVGPVNPPRTPPRLPIIIETLPEPLPAEVKDKKSDEQKIQTIIPPPGPTPMEEMLQFFRQDGGTRGDDKALGPYFDPSFQIAIPPPIPPTQSSAIYQKRE